MDRRSFLASQSLALMAAGLGATVGSASAATPGVLIAIPVIRVPDQSDEVFLGAIRKFADFLRKAPGFIDGLFLKSTFRETPFEYLEVTHWETRKHWEDLFSNREFLDLVERNNAFRVKAADVFIPVAL
jgi:heme-degrading monooxygenase HmoA